MFYRTLFHCEIRLLRQSRNYVEDTVTMDPDNRLHLLRIAFAAPGTHS